MFYSRSQSPGRTDTQDTPEVVHDFLSIYRPPADERYRGQVVCKRMWATKENDWLYGIRDHKRQG